MADSKQGAAPAPAAAQAAAKKGLPKKQLIIVAAVLLLAAGGTGTFLYLKKRAPAGATPAAQKDVARKLPNFVDLEPFTVNLAEKEQDRYMQIRFSLEVGSGEAETTIKDMMPALRSEVLLVLGARQSTDLASREGKEALAKDIVDASNKALEHTAAARSVTAVRITQLIIQ